MAVVSENPRIFIGEPHHTAAKAPSPGVREKKKKKGVRVGSFYIYIIEIVYFFRRLVKWLARIQFVGNSKKAAEQSRGPRRYGAEDAEEPPARVNGGPTQSKMQPHIESSGWWATLPCDGGHAMMSE